MRCEVLDLGVLEYDIAWKMQEAYARQIADGDRPPTLLLLEHPHIYTFGRKGHAENLLWGQEQLKSRGVDVRWVDRGGDVTYHGPGQLVGYPLIPLGRPTQARGSNARDSGARLRIPDVDYVGYLRKLERAIITALARFGIPSGQIPGLTGVWVQADVYSRCPRCRPEDRRKPAKIAAIGVKVDVQGISRHGFALNVSPDMSYWDGIIACGLADSAIVSMADLLQDVPDIGSVKRQVAAAFGEIFAYEVQLSPA